MTKKNRTLSLRARIAILTMAGIIISVILVGCVSIFIIRREKEVDNARQMNLLCDDYALTIDEFLLSVEQSVNMVSRYAIEDLDSVVLMDGGVVGANGYGDFVRSKETGPEEIERLDRYLSSHVDQVCRVYKSVANHALGVVSFYYRINPELTIGAVGNLYSRKGHAGFDEVPLTDLSAYPQDDDEHVGWYYHPLRSGRPVWMMPYNNLNLEERMVSYVVPLYKAGTFIGVIGMDIGYGTLADLVNQIQIFDTGYGYLVKEDGELVYHPFLPFEQMQESFTPEESPIIDLMNEKSESDDRTSVYTYNGETKAMAYHTLANGMKLVVVAPVHEINAEWRNLMNTILLISVCVLALFAFIATMFSRRITVPLQKLTDASRQLIAGNYNVDLPYSREDEVGTLTEAFRRLMQHLKIYVSDLNGKAYSDALTGIKNKAAFDIVTRKLNDGIRTQGPDTSIRFAMVMLDCNDLKVINDACGHDKGDIYLRSSCEIICRTFGHSPVFRTGGDEFVVLLQGEDFVRRNELLRTFERSCAEVNAAHTERWEKISMAKGMALFRPGIDSSAEEVLTRADEKMYEDKRAYKEGRRNG